MEETPQRVLVVIPHPDDAEFWCGGTVARWVQLGVSVHFMLCTGGGKGAYAPNANANDLAAIREGEQDKAAGILGVRDVVMLHYPDGELEDTKDFRREIVRQIRRVRPEVVICPEPYRRNLAWHRDHRITGQVTLDAVFPCARDHLHFQELWEHEGLEPHKTGAVLLWGAEQPDTYFDIGDCINVKIQALMAHQSQLDTDAESEVEGLIKEWAETAAAGQSYQYGEAFRKLTFRT